MKSVSNGSLLLLTCSIFSAVFTEGYLSKQRLRRKNEPRRLDKKYGITRPLEGDTNNKLRQHELIVKKEEIERAINQLENDNQKDKRGFLSNLASLLNDAEAISGHPNMQSGLSSVTLAEKSNSGDSSFKPTTTSNNGASSSTITSSLDTSSSSENAFKKEEIFPTTDQVKEALHDSSKDFAPIFAMLHGKIIPLGKIPDSAFKKSRTEFPKEANTTLTKHDEVRGVSVVQNTNNEVGSSKKDTELRKLSKLQQYLKKLDGHVLATGVTKNVRGSVKDEVAFPDEEAASPKSDILSHVKGVVLDDGKVVSVNSNGRLDGLGDSTKQIADADSQQKFVVSDDGTLNPLTKNSPEIGETVTRATTTNNEGQKTVALSLDVLKDLLKKSDNKVSLASLLNKSPDSKSDTPNEEEDPGTIEDFAAGGLKSHNTYRAKHHDGSLIWSDDLAAKAQKLAESLADKKTLEIAKDLEKEGYGENVAKVWATFKNAGVAATKMWYSQSENYRFDDPHLDENTGQFAQLIWKNTKELGMGVAKSIDDVNNKYVYVTALYKPPGNIEAALRENVLPTGNNTVDVYTTFFKRGGVFTKKNTKRSKLQGASSVINIVDERD